MNVKQLRESLEGVPDDYDLVRPSSDHSFSRIHWGGVISAGQRPAGELFEWAGEDNADDDETEVKVFVLE